MVNHNLNVIVISTRQVVGLSNVAAAVAAAAAAM